MYAESRQEQNRCLETSGVQRRPSSKSDQRCFHELRGIQLLSDRHDSREAMSGRLGMNKGRLTSLIRLSYLAPEIVRALLEGRQSDRADADPALATEQKPAA